jgi:hypothetical protein
MSAYAMLASGSTHDLTALATWRSLAPLHPAAGGLIIEYLEDAGALFRPLHHNRWIGPAANHDTATIN